METLAILMIFIGTVGLGVLLLIVVRRMLRSVARALKGALDVDPGSVEERDVRPTAVLVARHPRSDARPGLGGDRPLALSQVQHDLEARLALRKREATEASIFRAATSVRGPLGRPPDAA